MNHDGQERRSPSQWYWDLRNKRIFTHDRELREALRDLARETIAGAYHQKSRLITEAAALFDLAVEDVQRDQVPVIIPLMAFILDFENDDRAKLLRTLLAPPDSKYLLRDIAKQARSAVVLAAQSLHGPVLGSLPENKKERKLLEAISDCGIYPKHTERSEESIRECLEVLASSTDVEFEIWWEYAGLALREARNWDSHSDLSEKQARAVELHAQRLAPHVVSMLALVAIRFAAWQKKEKRIRPPSHSCWAEEHAEERSYHQRPRSAWGHRLPALRWPSLRGWAAFFVGGLLATYTAFIPADEPSEPANGTQTADAAPAEVSAKPVSTMADAEDAKILKAYQSEHAGRKYDRPLRLVDVSSAQEVIAKDVQERMLRGDLRRVAVVVPLGLGKGWVAKDFRAQAIQAGFRTTLAASVRELDAIATAPPDPRSHFVVAEASERDDPQILLHALGRVEDRLPGVRWALVLPDAADFPSYRLEGSYEVPPLSVTEAQRLIDLRYVGAGDPGVGVRFWAWVKASGLDLSPKEEVYGQRVFTFISTFEDADAVWGLFNSGSDGRLGPSRSALYEALLVRQLQTLRIEGRKPSSEDLLDWFTGLVEGSLAGSSAAFTGPLKVDMARCHSVPLSGAKMDCSKLQQGSVVKLDSSLIAWAVRARSLDQEFRSGGNDCAVLDLREAWLTRSFVEFLKEKTVGQRCSERVAQLLCKKRDSPDEIKACETKLIRRLLGVAQPPPVPALTPDRCSVYAVEAARAQGLGFRLTLRERGSNDSEPWQTVTSIDDVASRLDRAPIGPSRMGRIFVITGKPGVGKSPAAKRVLAHLCKHYPVQFLGNTTILDIRTPGWPGKSPGRVVVLDDMDHLSVQDAKEVASKVRWLTQTGPTNFIIFGREPVDEWFKRFEGSAWHWDLQPFSPQEGLMVLRRELKQLSPGGEGASATAYVEWSDVELQTALNSLGLAGLDRPSDALVRSFHDATAIATTLWKCWDRSAVPARPTCSRYQVLATLDDSAGYWHGNALVHVAWRADSGRPVHLEFVGELLDAWKGCPTAAGDRDSVLTRAISNRFKKTHHRPPVGPCAADLEAVFDRLSPAASVLKELLQDPG